ncbi:MAG: amino acid adenylation domain-containing protein, partial [bacterium]|nr:amino acid adenylation domain-containing protein [bacterium]
ITLFMKMLTILSIILAKYGGGEEIIIASPTVGRKRRELQSMVGFLVNTLVYRIDVRGEEGFKEQATRVKKETMAAYENQDYPFDVLVERLGMTRDFSRTPLFNVMLAFNNAEIAEAPLQLEGLRSTPYLEEGHFEPGIFDLLVNMDEMEDTIACRVLYNSDIFYHETIERLAANILTLTENLSAAPETAIDRIRCISGQEYKKILENCNGKEMQYPQITLREKFENCAAGNPDKIAVVYNHQKITYETLNREANRLARNILRGHTLNPGEIIAICMERSLEMIIAILGIIKTGAAYLSLDPTYPTDRIHHMLTDSRCEIVLADRYRPRYFENYKGRHIDINKEWPRTAAGGTKNAESKETAPPAENPGITNKPGDTIYVIYTSGTTGVPNGALLTHGILTNLVQWQQTQTTIDNTLRSLQFTSTSFCVSFQEIMTTLTGPGELHLIGEIERQDIDYLMTTITRQKIEILYLPFSYLNFLFNRTEKWGTEFKHSLRHIITAGEQLKITAGLRRFLEDNPQLQLHNHYGSSEMHVVASYTLDAVTMDREPVPPAGKPIANTRIFVMDEKENPVPIGVWGELYVSGSTEVAGYIYNERLSNQKKTSHPLLPEGKTFYRTGDIGRQQSNGNISLKGRKDTQVKIRGFRVELSEIESKIVAIKGVKDCMVVVKENKNGENEPLAYVVLENTEITAIKKIIRTYLPQYMIPRFIKLQTLPLMPNGKVDREKLPEPTDTNLENMPLTDPNWTAGPRSRIGITLAEIWTEVLEIEPSRINTNSNFFELGGHSLNATRMVANIHKELQVKIPLTTVFKNQTLEELTEALEGLRKNKYTAVTPVEKKEYYPLSPAQKRLYILQHMDMQSTTYNMPGTIPLPAEVTLDKLEGTIRKLIQRHDSLRTSFHMISPVTPGGVSPVQKIHDNPEFKIEVYGAGQSDKQRTFCRPFDLTRAPLLWVAVIIAGNGAPAPGTEMLVDMHHIITDATSLDILTREFLALLAGKNLPPLKLCYRDYTGWQSRSLQKELMKRQEGFWLKKFAGELPALTLPTDYPRPVIQSVEGDTQYFTLKKEAVENLRKIAADNQVTLYMAILSIFTLLLSKLSGQEDIIVGTPTAGRRHADLENIIG